MRLFTIAAIAALQFFIAPSSVQANGLKKADCDEQCQIWKRGIGSQPGKPTSCIVTIIAPTHGGQVALDVLDGKGIARWSSPRIKQVGPGVVKYRIGCNWLEEPTNVVYMCVDSDPGRDGNRFTSIRWRRDGDLDNAQKTRRLEMCLKGPECARFVEGEPPAGPRPR